MIITSEFETYRMVAARVPATQIQRPLGITVLGITYVVFAVLMILTVVAVLALTAIMGNFSSMMGGMMGNTMAIFGGVIVAGVGVLAAIEFAISGALFSGKSWGRTAVMVLAVVDLVIHGRLFLWETSFQYLT